MSNSSSAGALVDSLSDGSGPLTGTVPSFVLGLAVVVLAGLVVGPRTESYVAVAFTAYFLTTVYDLVVDRLGYREDLLARVRDAAGGQSEGDHE